MKWTVVITIKYYDTLNDFGTPLSVRYLVLFTIPNREPETAAIFNAKDVGRTGPRVQQATIYFANPFILLLYLISINMCSVKKSRDTETSKRRSEV